MAISFSRYVDGTASSGSTSASVGLSACSVGDFAFVVISRNNNSSPTGTPSGWSLLYLHDSTYRHFLYWKVLAAGDIGTVSWTGFTSGKTLATAYVYTGVADVTPPYSPGTMPGGTLRTIAFGSLASSQKWLFVCAACYSTTSKTFDMSSWSSPSWSERRDYGHTSPDFWQVGLDTNGGWTGGTFAPDTATNYISATATFRGSFIVQLMPLFTTTAAAAGLTASNAVLTKTGGATQLTTVAATAGLAGSLAILGKATAKPLTTLAATPGLAASAAALGKTTAKPLTAVAATAGLTASNAVLDKTAGTTPLTTLAATAGLSADAAALAKATAKPLTTTAATAELTAATTPTRFAYVIDNQAMAAGLAASAAILSKTGLTQLTTVAATPELAATGAILSKTGVTQLTTVSAATGLGAGNAVLGKATAKPLTTVSATTGLSTNPVILHKVIKTYAVAMAGGLAASAAALLKNVKLLATATAQFTLTAGTTPTKMAYVISNQATSAGLTASGAVLDKDIAYIELQALAATSESVASDAILSHAFEMTTEAVDAGLTASSAILRTGSDIPLTTVAATSGLTASDATTARGRTIIHGVAVSRVNYLENPSLETALAVSPYVARWYNNDSVIGEPAFSRVADPDTGTYALEWSYTAGAADVDDFAMLWSYGSEYWFKQNDYVTVSVRVKKGAGTNSGCGVALYLLAINADNSVDQQEWGPDFASSLTTSYQTFSFTLQVTDIETFRVYCALGATGVDDGDAWDIIVDSFLVERSATATGYFDGDTAAVEDHDYVWTGTAHASPSWETDRATLAAAPAILTKLGPGGVLLTTLAATPTLTATTTPVRFAYTIDNQAMAAGLTASAAILRTGGAVQLTTTPATAGLAAAASPVYFDYVIYNRSVTAGLTASVAVLGKATAKPLTTTGATAGLSASGAVLGKFTGKQLETTPATPALTASGAVLAKATAKPLTTVAATAGLTAATAVLGKATAKSLTTVAATPGLSASAAVLSKTSGIVLTTGAATPTLTASAAVLARSRSLTTSTAGATLTAADTILGKQGSLVLRTAISTPTLAASAAVLMRERGLKTAISTPTLAASGAVLRYIIAGPGAHGPHGHSRGRRGPDRPDEHGQSRDPHGPKRGGRLAARRPMASSQRRY